MENEDSYLVIQVVKIPLTKQFYIRQLNSFSSQKDLIIPYSNANLILKGVNYSVFSLFLHIFLGAFESFNWFNVQGLPVLHHLNLHFVSFIIVKPQR